MSEWFSFYFPFISSPMPTINTSTYCEHITLFALMSLNSRMRKW